MFNKFTPIEDGELKSRLKAVVEDYGCKFENVYIMDETHTILACGASAVTKLREPFGNNIERIFNFKYPYEYISGFDVSSYVTCSLWWRSYS